MLSSTRFAATEACSLVEVDDDDYGIDADDCGVHWSGFTLRTSTHI
jgi:hypothetical protein